MTRTFRRSWGIRALSVACVLLFGALEVYHLAGGGALISFGGILLGAFLAISGVATLLNLGDRYALDGEGIAYANPLLARLGLRVDRRIVWSEVVSVRAHHALSHGAREEKPGALFLDLVSGRRFVIDSVEDFDEIHRIISQHTATRTPVDARSRAEKPA